ncbi:MAG: hemerythrin domain-containing protein [Gammaproteobacteria bacterium]|nr:hemerythrin domain-containing protein [Gammaproteobacteria bacterium]
MYTLDELKKQNSEITDLIDVLSALINHQNLRGNPYVCDLVTTFNEKVWMHLVFEDNTIYSELARHHNPDISKIAKNFHESAREIKKDFSNYVKLWCKTSTDQASKDNFSKQSERIFKLISERIRFELEEMFPIVEKHYDS